MATVLEKFVSRLPKKSNVLLLCHSNADLDSIGTAAGLFFSLPKTHAYSIGVFGHPNQTANRLVEYLKIPLVLNPNLDSFDAVVCCDFNECSRLHDSKNQLSHFKKPVMIIDHHPKTKESVKTAFSIHEPDAQSASQLAFDLLAKFNSKLSQKSLVALACGMVSDSADLSIANAELIEKLGVCLKKTGLSVSDIHQLTAVAEPVSERLAKLKSLQRAQVFSIGNFLVASSVVDFFESQSASALILAGADIALVSGTDSKTKLTRLSLRVSHFAIQKTRFHAGKNICQPLTGFFGGSGNGHAGAAGFSCANASPAEVLQKAVELTRQFLEKSSNK